MITETSPFEDLTQKQREVLDLLLDHMTSKEIARQLGISPHTVDQRILHARQKLGAESRSELAVTYRQAKSIYEQSIYEESPLASLAIPLDKGGTNGAERLLTLNDRVRTEQDHKEIEKAGYLLVPEMLGGRYGVWKKVGAIAALALLMIFIALAGLAMFSQLSAIFGA